MPEIARLSGSSDWIGLDSLDSITEHGGLPEIYSLPQLFATILATFKYQYAKFECKNTLLITL